MEALDAGGLCHIIKVEMKRSIKITLIVIGIFILGLLLALVPVNLSSIRPGITIQQEHYDSLIALQDMAAQMDEYPVSALVLYKDSIIGAGFNSFRNKNEPLGHAEINALENMFGKMHYFEFRALSRDSLVLISSYEPCPMCKGVINHLDIRKVYYVKPKQFSYRLKYLRKEFSFNLKTRQIKVPEDQ
jgi:tRNA(adenine34) deaminase